jgi:hypothetical protein
VTAVPHDEEHAAQQRHRLIAYPVGTPTLDLCPAPVRRSWMDATPDRFANRCLPLLIANQSGWFLTTRHTVRVTWDGGVDQDTTTVEILDKEDPLPAVSHFGSGIVTWTIPYLFRTPPGWNLLVRGPANEPLDGAHALEGIVETDWSPATFTMNWKLTRAGFPVTFAKGQPVCMIVPQLRRELEAFDPVVADLEADKDLGEEYRRWMTSRAGFLEDLRAGKSAAVREKWQRDYFRGVYGDSVAPGHQKKRALQGFGPTTPAGGDRPRAVMNASTTPAT